MNAYNEISGFEDVYLEDSWVLNVMASPGNVEIDVEVVLLEKHPAYEAPRNGEAYCYRRSRISFGDVTTVMWTRQGEIVPAVDASGERDFGSIDVFDVHEGRYVLEGDFGHLEVTSNPPALDLKDVSEQRL